MEMSGEKILSGKSCLKLFIVSCIFASSIQVCIINMPSAAEECREPSGNVGEFHIVWRVVTLI